MENGFNVPHEKFISTEASLSTRFKKNLTRAAKSRVYDTQLNFAPASVQPHQALIAILERKAKNRAFFHVYSTVVVFSHRFSVTSTHRGRFIGAITVAVADGLTRFKVHVTLLVRA